MGFRGLPLHADGGDRPHPQGLERKGVVGVDEGRRETGGDLGPRWNWAVISVSPEDSVGTEMNAKDMRGEMVWAPTLGTPRSRH